MKLKKHNSYFNSPLFNIELGCVILDELHLMLRITEKLTENLITEVMQRDSDSDILKTQQQSHGIMLDTLVKTINVKGISFSIWERTNADGKGSYTCDSTSLIGSDKKELLHLLSVQLKSGDILFPETKAREEEVGNKQKGRKIRLLKNRA